MIDITGAWLGTYWQAGNPTRFEVTFSQARDTLTGRVSDAGPLGEANLDGSISGRQVTFTKRYMNRPSLAISYTGTLSEDGNYLSGQWVIDKAHSGTWEAQRSQDDLSQALKAFLEKKAPSELAGVR